MRKYYLDNLRFLCVLLLIPYHVCMIYNAFGENFYIRGPVIRPMNDFILLTAPWFMPLLFVVAGISSSYALKRRTTKQYIIERFYKLFIPLFFGLLIYIPIQTFYAERFHNQYSGSFFSQYILFFTKFTDLTGYTGGFTPGHLWFILYLFIISLVALPIMLCYNKSSLQINEKKLTILVITCLFLIPLVMTPLLDIGGKSIGEFLAFFLLGFFILSKEEVIKRLDTHRWWFLFSSIILLTSILFIFYNSWESHIILDIYYRMIRWISILAILGLGSHYLNFTNPITIYLSKASFPIYFFHQTWVIAIAFHLFQITSKVALQIPFIILLSFIFTLLNYEVFRRIPVTRFLFGIKK